MAALLATIKQRTEQQILDPAEEATDMLQKPSVPKDILEDLVLKTLLNGCVYDMYNHEHLFCVMNILFRRSWQERRVVVTKDTLCFALIGQDEVIGNFSPAQPACEKIHILLPRATF